MTRIIDFSKYSTIKIGSKREVFIIDEIGDYSDFRIVGNASNLLISPEANNLAILSKRFDYIKVENSHLFVGAKTSNGKLFSFCRQNSIAGFEFLSHLPGGVGGTLKMNAGVKSYEIFNNLVALKTAKGYIDRDKIDYGYRYSSIDEVIYEAVFKIEKGFSEELFYSLKNLRANQPKEPSAGSCFKNPQNDFAGRLIEAVGLKGFCLNGASFSEIHANFLVNLGSATYEDALSLIELAKTRVFESFGIELKEEVVII